jgi:hypothetical protein
VDSSKAARLAAAARARAARLSDERIKAAQARASARARARRRAQRARAVPAAFERARRPLVAHFEPESRAARVMPFAVVLMGLALLLFSLAAVPARVVPWSWAQHAIDNRREELAFSGIAALLAIAGLFLPG